MVYLKYFVTELLGFLFFFILSLCSILNFCCCIVFCFRCVRFFTVCLKEIHYCYHLFFVFRLYYTKVQLGSPPREFFVQIDTGSDVLWVSCSSCNGCPTASGLKVKTPITSRKVYTFILFQDFHSIILQIQLHHSICSLYADPA